MEYKPFLHMAICVPVLTFLQPSKPTTECCDVCDCWDLLGFRLQKARTNDWLENLQYLLMHIKLISVRFMGLKAALITKNSRLKSFGDKLGFTTLQLDELIKTTDSPTGLPVDVVAASQLLKLLGFQGGTMVEVSQFDLVFVHIGAGENLNGEKDKAFAHDMEYINALVGVILQTAQPGTEVGSRLHFSVVMSYGCVLEADNSKLSVLLSVDEKNSELSVLLPCQSYTMTGETPRDDVRHHCPMLISQWQYAVTRKDMAETFSFKNFKERGGNLVIPADRFLHEVAFKLWKAPKYGA